MTMTSVNTVFVAIVARSSSSGRMLVVDGQ